MLGAELGQMPAWYVELSYALALEQCALLQQQPKSPALLALEQGVQLYAACNTWDNWSTACGHISLDDGNSIVVTWLCHKTERLFCPVTECVA